MHPPAPPNPIDGAWPSPPSTPPAIKNPSPSQEKKKEKKKKKKKKKERKNQSQGQRKRKRKKRKKGGDTWTPWGLSCRVWVGGGLGRVHVWGVGVGC